MLTNQSENVNVYLWNKLSHRYTLTEVKDMSQITTDFFNSSTILPNEDTVRVMNFLSQPESVNRMIVMSKVGLPSLTGVVKELENLFGDCELFPLNHNAENSNAPNRRNIGWMVRFVMKAYGYVPSATNDSFERTRIGKFSEIGRAHV